MPSPDLPELPTRIDRPVLVVGDVLIDRYWHGTASRVSQEAPVPVVDVGRVEDRPGGAANVALNVVALGAPCVLVGVVGDDAAGRALETQLAAAGVRCEFVRVPGFATLTKVRIISQQQQLLRADFETPVPAAAAAEALARVVACVQRDAPGAVVCEDYDKGTVQDGVGLVTACGSVPLVVDPKLKPPSEFAGATVLKPNEAELRQWLSPWPEDMELAARLEAFRADHQLGALALTRGARGLLLVDGSQPLDLPARRVEVYDVTGAGDTVAATLGVALAAGLPLRAGARLANLAASLAVSRAGTVAISAPELVAAARTEARPDRGVLDRTALAAAVSRARDKGERIVFTNGCFDVLHAGHVAYLQEARQLGDRLVVAVNDDASVRRLKGAGRPVNGVERRAQVLAALAVVDWVVPFAEDTPEALLHALRPDVLVKGGDYQREAVVGHEIVDAYGGEVRVLSLVEGLSTSLLMDRLRGAGAAPD